MVKLTPEYIRLNSKSAINVRLATQSLSECGQNFKMKVHKMPLLNYV